MSGEWQFLFYREDSDADAAFTLCGRVARKNERGLGEIHLLGDGLHFGIGEAARVGKYCQRIAFERIGSKYVPLRHRQTALLLAHVCPVKSRLSCHQER